MSYKRKMKRDPEFIKNQDQFKKEVSENIASNWNKKYPERLCLVNNNMKDEI